MGGWGLRVAAVLVTLVAFAGSLDYALTHAKNSAAPLQPPVANRPSPSAPASAPPTLPPLVTQRGGRTPAPGTPAPLLTIQPGVRFATLPPITFTHVS